jgi:hypothetical protein
MTEDQRYLKLKAHATQIIFIVEIAYCIFAVLSFDMLVAWDVIIASLTTGVQKLVIISILATFLTWRHSVLFNSNMTGMVEFLKMYGILVIPLVVAYVYGFMAITQGICGCDFSDDIPGHVINGDGMNLSTAFMRYYIDKDLCPADKTPCMVYATLPENALNQVFINFHVNLESCLDENCEPSFEYIEGNVPKATNFSDWRTAKVVRSEYRSPVTEYNQRHVFTTLLKNLKANTFYSFRITEPNWNNTKAKIYAYKTFDPTKMTIMNGGDVGNSKLAHKMMKNVVSNSDFDLIMVGGDVAYDQNSPNCHRAWDYLLLSYPVLRYDNATGSTRVLPVLYSTGNHDFGKQSFTDVEVKHTPHEPIFKHFYPQNTDENGDVPNLLKRKSYFSQTIGDVLIVNLDSQYEAPMGGEQSEWLEKVLSSSDSKVKLAQYHGPIYPSCRQGHDTDYMVVDAGKKYWTPLFDKYNLTISFENHAHSFKRMKKIKNHVADPTGTLYLGEGSWGVPGDCSERENEDLVDVYSFGDGNAWIVKIDTTAGIDNRAYNADGNEIDSYYMPID